MSGRFVGGCALRSATESVALLDAAHELNLSTVEEPRRNRELGIRIVAMLTKLVLAFPRPPSPYPFTFTFTLPSVPTKES